MKLKYLPCFFNFHKWEFCNTYFGANTGSLYQCKICKEHESRNDDDLFEIHERWFWSPWNHEEKMVYHTEIYRRVWRDIDTYLKAYNLEHSPYKHKNPPFLDMSNLKKCSRKELDENNRLHKLHHKEYRDRNKKINKMLGVKLSQHNIEWEKKEDEWEREGL